MLRNISTTVTKICITSLRNKANKYLYKLKMVQCNHKWKIPLMYDKNNYYNPTECVKCGKSISHLFDNRVNWRGQRIFKPKQR